MKDDDETTATQLVKLLEDQGHQISKTTVIRARRTLGWTFHGSRYCQMIKTRKKELRGQQRISVTTLKMLYGPTNL